MAADEYKQHLADELRASGLGLKQWYNERYLYSDHWKHLRARKFEQVGRRCEKCRSSKKIQVHHLQYRNIYDVEMGDLQVLCRGCHEAEHGIVRAAPRPLSVGEQYAKDVKDQRRARKRNKVRRQKSTVGRAKIIMRTMTKPLHERLEAIYALWPTSEQPPQNVMKFIARRKKIEAKSARKIARGNQMNNVVLPDELETP